MDKINNNKINNNKINNNVRVRFAPSPTGIMHLGNVRTALINYIFAKKYNGDFILRIEDTDFNRNIENLSNKIIEDLLWLGIDYNKGPYYQSERKELYKEYLKKLIEKNLVYRCFCTIEELENKRKEQILLKLPPRYERFCLKLTEKEINNNIEINKPFIWRFKLDHDKTVEFYDLAHKNMYFELKHFSDISITRQDGSFTFIFANFVDDYLMKISHVFRGEDHLSNTACQVALYQAFDFKIPIFWHLPIIGNKDGKKLSKRDFGFSLNDLIDAGYLKEAICNYLVIIGGSFKKEILNKEELIQAIDFDNILPTGMIKYDVDKLRWVNHQWILEYLKNNKEELIKLCIKFIEKKYLEINNLSKEKLEKLVFIIAPEINLLKDSVNLVSFYFTEQNIDLNLVKDILINKENIIKILKFMLENIENNNIIESLKLEAKKEKENLSNIFKIVRLALTGKVKGPNITDILDILEKEKIVKRLNIILDMIKIY